MSDVIPPFRFASDEVPWARWAQNRIVELGRRAGLSAQEGYNQGSTQAGTIRALSQQIVTLQETVDQLPITRPLGETRVNFGLSAGWQTVLSLTIPSIPGKDSVSIHVTGQGAVLDKTSGGLTTSECRIVVDSVTSPVTSAAKDAGASMVLNILNNTFVTQIATNSEIPVSFQMRPLNPAAFTIDAGNQATLSVFAVHSAM